jgi:hypothetical protein
VRCVLRGRELWLEFASSDFDDDHHQAPTMTATINTPARMRRKNNPTTRLRIKNSTTIPTIAPTLERVIVVSIISGQWAAGSWQFKQPCLCCQLPGGLLFLVARAHNGLDVAANVEVAFDFDAQGVAGRDKIFEDDVDDVLVENLHLPK